MLCFVHLCADLTAGVRLHNFSFKSRRQGGRVHKDREPGRVHCHEGETRPGRGMKGLLSCTRHCYRGSLCDSVLCLLIGPSVSFGALEMDGVE